MIYHICICYLYRCLIFLLHIYIYMLYIYISYHQAVATVNYPRPILVQVSDYGQLCGSDAHSLWTVLCILGLGLRSSQNRCGICIYMKGIYIIYGVNIRYTYTMCMVYMAYMFQFQVLPVRGYPPPMVWSHHGRQGPHTVLCWQQLHEQTVF